MITIVQLIKKELFFKKHYALTCNVRRLSQVSTLSRSTALGVTNIREQKARVSRRERKDMFDYKRQREVSFGFLTKGLKDQGTTIDVSAISARRKPRSFGADIWDGVTFPSHLPTPCKFLWLKFSEGCDSVWRPRCGSLVLQDNTY